jgi:hypothetical protein
MADYMERSMLESPESKITSNIDDLLSAPKELVEEKDEPRDQTAGPIDVAQQLAKFKNNPKFLRLIQHIDGLSDRACNVS